MSSRFSATAILITALLSLAGFERLNAADISQMRLAAYQLTGAQLSSGLLEFDIDFLLGRGGGSGETEVDRTAFIARQAVAAYALAKYLSSSKDTKVSGSVRHMIATFGRLSLPVGKATSQQWLESTRLLSTPIGRYELHVLLDLMGLLYRPIGDGKLLSYEGGYGTAWTGSTALALATELEYFSATGDDRFRDLRVFWLKGLQALYVPGRGFREYPRSLEEAAYVNGETWLALGTYAAKFPGDEMVRTLLMEFDSYLIRKYLAEPDSQFFSWGTLAAVRRLATTSDPKFADFIARQASHFVDQELPAAQQHENTCALVEGLAAAAGVLAKNDENRTLLKRLMARIEREMTKNQALQIPFGTIRLDYQDGSFFHSPRLAEYAGAYLSGGANLYTRIDITGHCLSALLEIQNIGAGQ